MNHALDEKGAVEVEVLFLGQPFPSDSFSGWTAEWLQDRLSTQDISQVKIAVAWAKRSGLSRLYGSLTAFKTRGGKTSLIVGIDEGGATEQGLRLALDLFDTVHVFHDIAARTFHPKLYLTSGPSSAEVVVGSNNVTAGGLFSNYEAALACKLNLESAADQELFANVNNWFDTLYGDANACKPLTLDLLAVLSKDSQYNITNEDLPKRGRPRGEEDYDGVTGEPVRQSIFSKSSSKKRSIPPKIYTTSEPTTDKKMQGPTANGKSPPSAAQMSVLRWTKRLSASDAQHPRNTNSAPTGNLKLTSAGDAIDRETFFRQLMFGDSAWAGQQTKRGTKEEAIVTFDVIIDGSERGSVNLKIDHAAYRIADQNNVPTWLHWGPLGTVLRSTNYTGAWAIIEQLADGSHRLEISQLDPNAIA